MPCSHHAKLAQSRPVHFTVGSIFTTKHATRSTRSFCCFASPHNTSLLPQKSAVASTNSVVSSIEHKSRNHPTKHTTHRRSTSRNGTRCLRRHRRISAKVLGSRECNRRSPRRTGQVPSTAPSLIAHTIRTDQAKLEAEARQAVQDDANLIKSKKSRGIMVRS